MKKAFPIMLMFLVFMSAGSLAQTTIAGGDVNGPVENSTTFRYRLFLPCYVELNVYNISGQKIKCLVAGKQPAGIYSLEWNMNPYKSGQYFYQLKTNTGFVQTRKMLVLKQ